MKIAFLSFYSGEIERGVENWTTELACRLSDNHDVILLQNNISKRTLNKIKIYTSNIGINWSKKNGKLSLSKRLFVDYWSLLVLKFSLKSVGVLLRENPDIIIPTNGGWQTLIIRIVTWIKRSKMVVVSHSGQGWDERVNLWCFPDLFVALTPKLEKWAGGVNSRIKITNIPNGVDTDKFSDKGDVTKLDLQTPIYLFVGHLNPEKGVDLAIQAVSRLNKGSLLVLGSGDRLKEIEIMGRNFLGNRFKICQAEYEQMPKYYRACDVFTLPSWKSEAFGMVYLEAMACGLPVVATNDETRKYIIGKAGMLVDPLDISKYVRALTLVAEKSWGEIPKKRAERFSWDKIVKQYEDAFLKLISDK